MHFVGRLRHWPWLVAAGLTLVFSCMAGPLLTRPPYETAMLDHVSVVKAIQVAVPAPPKAPPPSTEARYAAPGAPPAQEAPNAVASRRALERSAEISLYVDDVAKAVSSLSALADVTHGDVVSLNDQRPASDRDARVAEVKVEVPSTVFDEALGRATGLGVVRSRTVDAQDVGNELVDDAARLRNLRRTEGDIAKIMDRSGRIAEVLDAQTQLSAVREEIEKLAAERAALVHRVSYATLDVQLEGAVVPALTRPTVGTRLAQAWHTASERFVDAFVSLTTLAFNIAVALPYAIVGLTLFAATIAIARRRRRTA